MSRRKSLLKKLLAVAALILCMAAFQDGLWRPEAAPQRVTAAAGGTAIVPYYGRIVKAVIFQKRTASLSTAGPGRLLVHGLAPGSTSLLIHYQNGDTRLYQIVVLPG